MKHIQSGCLMTDTCGGTCEGCCLAVCVTCGCYEGSLTTECPGEPVSYDKRQEIYETPSLDYTTKRGWHNAGHQSIWDRVAIFEDDQC